MVQRSQLIHSCSFKIRVLASEITSLFPAKPLESGFDFSCRFMLDLPRMEMKHEFVRLCVRHKSSASGARLCPSISLKTGPRHVLESKARLRWGKSSKSFFLFLKYLFFFSTARTGSPQVSSSHPVRWSPPPEQHMISMITALVCAPVHVACRRDVWFLHSREIKK